MNCQDRIFKSIVAHRNSIQRKEQARKEKPTNSDLWETRKILCDFGIIMEIEDIPDFSSAYELEKWRTKKIMDFLDPH